jgi:hypothetical protein
MTPYEVDGGADGSRPSRDVPVGPAKILAPGGPEDACRRGRLIVSHRNRAVGRHFPFGEIAQTDDVAGGGVAGDRAAEPDLDVVGMRAEYEQVD